MIVVDASVLANALADDGCDGGVARARLSAGDDLVAPDLVDVETVAVLRKRWMAGDRSKNRCSAAIDDLEDLELVRYPALPLTRRTFELRDNVTAYGAVYVALAERLDRPLVTANQLLAAAPGISCSVEVLAT